MTSLQVPSLTPSLGPPRALGGSRLYSRAVYGMPLAATPAPAELMEPDKSSTAARLADIGTRRRFPYKVFRSVGAEKKDLYLSSESAQRNGCL